MANTYHKFLKKNIDLAPLGVEHNANEAAYFCTPKGANIIGWAGVDGIHYCSIRGFGEMVFAVSPMNAAPDYVHPLAENFADFLRLLLACGHADALEQTWMWDKMQFEAFLKENPITEEQENTLAEIADKMKLTAMENPWESIKSLQSSFDYSKIKYTEEYYDMDLNPAAEPVAPQWKVYFGGTFWGHDGKDHAGKEITIGKQFEWAGAHWLIPAVYSCSKGLVVDFCMRVEPEAIRTFLKKWNLSKENDSCENFTQEQQMKIELDNPLRFQFKPQLEINGQTLQPSRGCATSFNPCLQEEARSVSQENWIMEHYGLDAAYGWVIYRNSFPWKYKRRPEIKTLSLTMEQDLMAVPGPHFKLKAPGDSFRFIHPVSQTEYTLTMQELEQHTLPQSSFQSDRWIYPTHLTAMSYTLSPETSERIEIHDCEDSESPIEINPSNDSFTPSAAHFIAFASADKTEETAQGEKLHAACSALHFEPVQHNMEWRITFYVKQFENIILPLL